MGNNQRSLLKGPNGPEGEFQCEGCTIFYKTDATGEENLVLDGHNILVPKCPNCGDSGHVEEEPPKQSESGMKRFSLLDKLVSEGGMDSKLFNKFTACLYHEPMLNQVAHAIEAGNKPINVLMVAILDASVQNTYLTNQIVDRESHTVKPIQIIAPEGAELIVRCDACKEIRKG